MPMDLIAEITATLRDRGYDPGFVDELERHFRGEYGGERIYIPKRGENGMRQMLERDRRIVRMHKSGEHVPVIAKREGLSRPRVYQILQEYGAR